MSLFIKIMEQSKLFVLIVYFLFIQVFKSFPHLKTFKISSLTKVVSSLDKNKLPIPKINNRHSLPCHSVPLCSWYQIVHPTHEDLVLHLEESLGINIFEDALKLIGWASGVLGASEKDTPQFGPWGQHVQYKGKDWRYDRVWKPKPFLDFESG